MIGGGGSITGSGGPNQIVEGKEPPHPEDAAKMIGCVTSVVQRRYRIGAGLMPASP